MNPPISSIEQLDPKEYILIKGAKVNNLREIDVAIPRNKLVVITGLSGSGKSSLAFDTLFAEGQRMYVESLSAYARQFLGRMEKPAVEWIRGISPAIAIEQKGNSRNPRATVGTTTEIYDYLKLFFARVGTTYSPVSGQIVRKDTVTDVVNYLLAFAEGTRAQILCNMHLGEGRTVEEELKVLFQKGFSRVLLSEKLVFIEDLLANPGQIAPVQAEQVLVLIDRAVLSPEDEDTQYRLADSIQTAFYEGQGTCIVEVSTADAPPVRRIFSNRFEADGITFEEPSVAFFSFNNPYGACRRCGGWGDTLAIDESLVIPDPSLSVFEGAVMPWRSDKMQEWKDAFVKGTRMFDFPVHRAYQDLNDSERWVLWNGNQYVQGINHFFDYVESQTHKIQYRVLLSRYRGRVVCPDCRGTRLRKDAGYVRVGGKSIVDLVLMPIKDILQFVEQLQLTEYEEKIARRVLPEIRNRLAYLDRVGLGYLTLNRLTQTLSGGEYQRIKLSTALGSALVGSMYILDEPSIGLHPRDTARLIQVLQDLRDLGNTVIVVEHEEEVMRAADQIIDIGPEAGSHGGQLVFQGSWADITQIARTKKHTSNGRVSHTINFLTGKDTIAMPATRRSWREYIEIIGARQHNLKNISVKFPLDVFTVVTGVSGSGKSTLVKDILVKALQKYFGQVPDKIGTHERIAGSLKYLKGIEFVDQNPIGKSSRSNPATYTKVYDQIRDLFAGVPLAKQRGYESGHFSFNSEKGRCDTCQGEGKLQIEMQFLADVYLTCESCGGKRFKKEILEVEYKGKNVADVLEMTIDDALEFFADQVKLRQALAPLAQVGLGYVQLGQSTATLSGGEAQRLKLANFLRERRERTLFVFDEPTTGLHFHDIGKLLTSFQALIEQGHSVLVIEHNLEIIKCADWVIDLGPDGGNAGGEICFAGLPEDLAKIPHNLTGIALKAKMEK